MDEPIDESKESEQIISSQQPVESSELPTIQEVITPVEQPKQEESFVDYIKDIIKKIATYKLGLSSLDSVKEKVSELKAKVESGIEEQKAELAKLEEKEAEYGNCERLRCHRSAGCPGTPTDRRHRRSSIPEGLHSPWSD